LYERSVPIDYKRKSIFLEYSNEQQLPEEKDPLTEEEESGEKAKGEKVNGEKANGEKAKGDKVKGEKVKGENVKGKEKTDKTEKSFDTLIKEIEESLFDVLNTKKLVKGEKNWYRHAGLIVNVLKSKYGFDDNSVRKYMLDHILDMLLFADKMILINHLYGDTVPTNMTPVQELIKSYLDKRRVQSSGLVGFVIMKDDILRIYVENEETGQFVEADREDYELFVRDIARFDVPKNSIHPLVGFVNLFTSKKSNQKEMVFKVKDLNQKRNNTGARIDDAGKEKIVKFLNIILGDTIYNDENTENITQLGLCAILEMLMRQKTENSILGLVGMNTVYFLTPEQTAITEIVKYSK